jgi:hypothetical protein
VNNGGVVFSAAAWDRVQKQWWGLPHRKRREVSRLSKQGKVHPQPEVAEIAYRWAVMQVSLGDRNFLAKRRVAIPLAVITLSLGGGSAGASILSTGSGFDLQSASLQSRRRGRGGKLWLR